MDPASEVHRALGWEVVQKYMFKYENGIWGSTGKNKSKTDCAQKDGGNGDLTRWQGITPNSRGIAASTSVGGFGTSGSRSRRLNGAAGGRY